MVASVPGAAALQSPRNAGGGKSIRQQIRDAVELAISRYPSMGIEPVGGIQYDLNALMTDHAARIAFHLEVLVDAIPKGGRVADIGAGLTPHGHALALLGYRSVLIDDFGDRWYANAADLLESQKRDGVQVVSRDVIRNGVALDANSFDAVMTIDCLEHLHHSPKKMLMDCVTALRPGGLFFLGVPNCVNLRKRITVPLGVGKWSRMQEWYEDEVFRGHVREPDVDDLRYIANSLGLQNVRIIGRNWLGYESRSPLIQLLLPITDPLLQLFPTLCSNIYLLGTKPAA